MDTSALDTINPQRNHAVIEEHLVAGCDILMQRVKSNPDSVDGSVFVSKFAVEKEVRAVGQLYVMPRESLYPDLRALEVPHQADITAALASRSAQLPRPHTMFFGIAV
jgi:hypothetical protein